MEAEDRRWKIAPAFSILYYLRSSILNPRRMLTLAIETSGPLGSIALVDGANVLGEEALELGRQHGQSLIPAIGRILEQAGKTPRDLALLAVSVGPGSFTGLRVGVVCAKTLAYATGCRLAAVDTLQAIAGNSPPEVSTVEVVCDAHRGDLFVGRYNRVSAEAWEPAAPIEVVNAERWRELLPPDGVVTGPALEKLAPLMASRCRIVPAELWVPQATWIARLGRQAVESGNVSDLWSVEPVYLRRSSAELQWERLHPGG